MTDITIPPETVKAVKELLYPFLHTESDGIAYDIARAACLALIQSWPNANWDEAHTIGIILPLTEKP